MANKIRDDEPAFGSDSFLDIVANMVGILIILVMVAGLRAKDVSHLEPQPDAAQAAALEELELEAEQLSGDVRQLDRQLRTNTMTLAGRQQERDQLLLASAEGKRLLDAESGKLDSRRQEEYQLRQVVAARETELNRLTQQLQAAAMKQSSQIVKIDNYPTPISRTVHGHEIHFRLQDNRISYVPIDELVDVLKKDVQRKAQRLQDVSEVTETIGPAFGYRMKYTLGREAVPNGFRVQLLQFVMLPLVDELGETLEQAMRPESQFYGALTRTNPRNTTVTLWTYPESYATYHAIKKELYNRGFSVAGRPLPSGQPIAGSPQGSRSAAE
ncbi:MAG: hypothetical protein JSS27_07810 [Planctomycetes bacterium]|nr:hypothetical protein [Planctomycetota bacterium]